MVSSRFKYRKNSVHSSKYGKFKVLEYVDSKNIRIKFHKTGYETVTQAYNLYKDEVKDPYFPSVYGVGYLGVGPYSKADKRLYALWANMIGRCYYDERAVAYKGLVIVDVRWHNFQNFCIDVIKLKNWNTDGFQIDKDILKKGNNVYGPGRCCFVPKKLNTFFQISSLSNNGHCVTGVVLQPSGKYKARIANGSFLTEEEAYKAHCAKRVEILDDLIKTYESVLDERVVKKLKQFKLPSYKSLKMIRKGLRNE